MKAAPVLHPLQRASAQSPHDAASDFDPSQSSFNDALQAYEPAHERLRNTADSREADSTSSRHHTKDNAAHAERRTTRDSHAHASAQHTHTTDANHNEQRSDDASSDHAHASAGDHATASSKQNAERTRGKAAQAQANARPIDAETSPVDAASSKNANATSQGKAASNGNNAPQSGKGLPLSQSARAAMQASLATHSSGQAADTQGSKNKTGQKPSEQKIIVPTAANMTTPFVANSANNHVNAHSAIAAQGTHANATQGRTQLLAQMLKLARQQGPGTQSRAQPSQTGATSAVHDTTVQGATVQGAAQSGQATANNATLLSTLTSQMPTQTHTSSNTAMAAHNGGLQQGLEGQNGVLKQLMQAANGNNASQLHAATTANADKTTNLANLLHNMAPVQSSPQTISLKQPVGSSRWQHEFETQLTWLAKNGVQSAKMQLHPAHMGSIEVHIKLLKPGSQNAQAMAQHNANSQSTLQPQTQVFLQVDHAATRAAIQQSLPQLQQMFDQSGINLASAQVLADGAAQQQGDQQASEQHARKEGGSRAIDTDTDVDVSGHVHMPATTTIHAVPGRVDAYA